MKEGKVWGTTEVLEENSQCEFHRLVFEAGACCSEHYHEIKYNGFFVESGVMEIRVWTDPDDLYNYDSTILKAGDYMHVAPGVWHQFVGIESGVAFELYWAELLSEDIVRRTKGHVLGEEETFPVNGI